LAYTHLVSILAISRETLARAMWTGISETLNPKSALKGIDSVGALIVSTLRKEGLIAK